MTTFTSCVAGLTWWSYHWCRSIPSAHQYHQHPQQQHHITLWLYRWCKAIPSACDQGRRLSGRKEGRRQGGGGLAKEIVRMGLGDMLFVQLYLRGEERWKEEATAWLGSSQPCSHLKTVITGMVLLSFRWKKKGEHVLGNSLVHSIVKRLSFITDYWKLGAFFHEYWEVSNHLLM